MSTHAAIRIETRGPVTVVTFDDGKANALSSPVMNALRHTLREVASTAGAIVLAGRPGFYSGGLDIKLMPSLSYADRVETAKDLGRLLIELFLLPRPVIAAMTGHALGGGALIALACDARLASEGKMRFGLNEVAIGLALPTFGVEIARSSIPTRWLTEATLHARVYSAEEALARGLVDSVHAPDGLTEAALARADAVAGLPQVAYETTKRRVRGPAVEVMKAGFDAEIEGFLKGFEQ